ncbi:MAG: DUF4333 domain-containing protein [Leptolyngbya sp. SIO1E4]|nr:DUF4333 domain-containing protein [Leptolyngbya sp. SIO1E4]
MQRTGMRSVYRLALLFGGLLTLTGCFNRLDIDAIEREIETEIESQSRRISLAEVRCPRDVYRQSGAYFRCVGHLRPEGQFTINVTQQDNQGTVDWDVPSSQVILNLAKVEAKLQEDFAQQFSKRAIVDCGELYRVNQPGEQFECQVIGGANLGQDAVTALLVRVDPEGNLNWYEVREAIAPVADAAAETEGQSGEGSPEGAGQTGTPETQESGAPRERIAGTREVERPRVPGDDD